VLVVVAVVKQGVPGADVDGDLRSYQSKGLVSKGLSGVSILGSNLLPMPKVPDHDDDKDAGEASTKRLAEMQVKLLLNSRAFKIRSSYPCFH
jgi:hypothetical protein